MNSVRLFRNKSTEENMKNLACLIYHYDTRGETSIGLELLKTASIGNISDDDIFYNNKKKYPILQKYVNNLLQVGFISRSNESYKPGSYRKKYHVNKEKILNQYGQEIVLPYKKILSDSIYNRYSRDNFVLSVQNEPLELFTNKEVQYKLLSPGEMVFYKNGKQIKKLKYLDNFGKQLFQLKSFYFNKDAIIDFVRSIKYLDVPDESQDKISYINKYVGSEFIMDFEVHFSIMWSSTKKSFTIKKAARAYSAFCSTKKSGEERTNILNKEGLTKSYDIKSTLPRISYLIMNDKWIDTSIDLYESIYKNSGITKEWNNNLREIIKKCFMMIYFVDHPHKSYNAYVNSDCDKIFSKEEYTKLYKSVYSILGKSFGAYIFYLESLLEIDVIYHFMNEGHKIVNIYDGFYFQDDLNEKEIESYIEKTCTNYILGESKCKRNH